MSKMAHVPFGHLQHKLWTKEGLGVKLTVWLPTTKSWESTRPWRVQVECDTPLESFQGELQVCFRFHPDRRSEQGVMNSQSPKSPNRDSSKLLLESLGKKCHWDVGVAGKHKEYYMGEGGGFSRFWVVVSHVSPVLPMACPSTESAFKCELTNLLMVWCRSE